MKQASKGSKHIGDLCKCGKPYDRRKSSFYWRGKYEDAAFCFVCNSIWPIVGEEIEPLKPVTLENKDG